MTGWCFPPKLSVVAEAQRVTCCPTTTYLSAATAGALKWIHFYRCWNLFVPEIFSAQGGRWVFWDNLCISSIFSWKLVLLNRHFIDTSMKQAARFCWSCGDGCKEQHSDPQLCLKMTDACRKCFWINTWHPMWHRKLLKQCLVRQKISGIYCLEFSVMHCVMSTTNNLTLH